MGQVVTISDHQVMLADPVDVNEFAASNFIGRKEEISLCMAAWNYSSDGGKLLKDSFTPLNFRLEGPPGVGKNEIVYQMVKSLKKPLFIIQGHEELTPEDLALLLVPDAFEAGYGNSKLMLRASPLATAIYLGGICLFDEINRVPYRALSPLASVLDSRLSIYSALAGIHIKPKDPEAARNFRFCCALNPALSEAGSGVLPEYIDQRTLPAIQIGYPEIKELEEMMRINLGLDDKFMSAFKNWYEQSGKKELSNRQALTLLQYALHLSAANGNSPEKSLEKAAEMVIENETEKSDLEEQVDDSGDDNNY